MGIAELLLISGLFLAGYSVYLFVNFLLSSQTEQKALMWAKTDSPVKSKSKLVEFSRPLVHNFTVQHAAKIKNVDYRSRIEKLLITSGLNGEMNVDEYIGLQMLWGILLPFVLMVLNFALELGYSTIAIIVLGSIGFLFPSFYCRGEQKRRYRAVIIDLPFFIDLLALSTEAGLDFIGAIQRIVEKAENSVLGDEFREVLRDIKLGSSRSEALKKMSERLSISEITSFVAMVVDADSTGASIASVLKDQSTQMRLERFVRAEKAGAQAAQTMLIPLMLFILPAVFIMVFAPVALQFFYGGK